MEGVFARGVTIRGGEQLLFVSDRADCSPLGLYLDEDGVALLRRIVRTGCEFVVGREGLSYRDSALTLSLSPEGGYDCRLCAAPLSEECCRRWLACAEAETRSTGLGTLVFCVEEALPSWWRVSLCGRDRPEIARALRVIMGRGPGLTPSGDDVLLGMLLLHAQQNFLSGELLDVLEGLLAEELTTLVSRCYLREGLLGHFSATLREIAGFLAGRGGEPLNVLWQRLTQYGHTSGLDTAAGMVVALRCLLMLDSADGAKGE